MTTRRPFRTAGLGMALLAVAPPLATSMQAQTWRTMTSERQLWDHTPLTVSVEYGAGRLLIRPAEAPSLYRMELRYDEESTRPEAEYDPVGRTLRLGVRRVEGHSLGGLRDGAAALIELTRQIPLDLDLKFGAANGDLEFGGLSMRRLAIATGASETTISFSEPNRITAEAIEFEVGAAGLHATGLGNARARQIRFQGGLGATVLDFGGDWDRDAAVSVQMGVGSLTLRLPRVPGVRINRNSFLTSFSAPGLQRQGNSYYSGNWQQATRRITIDISAALGAIEIQWID